MDNNFKGQALNFNVVVLPIEVKNETLSGLDVSNSVDKNEKYHEGRVVSVGEMCPRNEKGKPYVNVGDFVVYDKHKKSDFTQNGILYENIYYADLFLKK